MPTSWSKYLFALFGSIMMDIYDTGRHFKNQLDSGIYVTQAAVTSEYKSEILRSDFINKLYRGLSFSCCTQLVGTRLECRGRGQRHFDLATS